DITALVTSPNPPAADSLHSNVALQVSGTALLPLLQSELEIARGSGWIGDWEPPAPSPAAAGAKPAAAGRVQVLTEYQIGAAIERNLAGTRAGDSIDIAMFY